MGFDPTTPKFVKALRVLYQISHKGIEERVKVYISLGFDVDHVWEMFKKDQLFLTISEESILNSFETLICLGFTRDEFVMMASCFPPLLRYSVESVKMKTHFLLEKMNWTLKAVTMFPPVYGYSLEKRLEPRSYVIQALRTRGLLGSEMPPMSSVFSCTHQGFLNRYMVKHDDNKQLVAELMAIFTEHRAS